MGGGGGGAEGDGRGVGPRGPRRSGVRQGQEDPARSRS
ncbi:hypothetical protein SFR_6008 [Streptomyces sp. FR-008]|nr:hypothetical protein SFR_6008 [Streptomyces sp. FR-008]